MNLQKGTIITWARTFSEEETLQFAELSGDKGNHHMQHDEKGRLMVHGLLTTSIGTKIAGDLNYIVREMKSEYLRPVFTGDTITCEVILTNVEQKKGFKNIEIESIYKNQVEKEVLIATSHGIIRD